MIAIPHAFMRAEARLVVAVCNRARLLASSSMHQLLATSLSELLTQPASSLHLPGSKQLLMQTIQRTLLSHDFSNMHVVHVVLE